MSVARDRSCMPLAQEFCQGHGLEIGAASYSDFGVDAWNLDLVADPLETYRAEQMKHGGKVAPIHIVGFAETLPLKDASQDFLLASHVLEHSPNPIATLIEWDRVIRPGGILFLIIPHKERTPDRVRPRTSLAHVIEDYRSHQTIATHRETDGFLTPPSLHTPHYHAWITLDFLEIVAWMVDQQLVTWHLEEIEDVDSDRHSGFTFVLRKHSQLSSHKRTSSWVSRRALRSMLRCPEQIGFLKDRGLIEDRALLEVLAGTIIWQDILIQERERLIKSHEWEIGELGRQLDDVRAWARSMEAALRALHAKPLHVPALSALRGRLANWRRSPKTKPSVAHTSDPVQSPGAALLHYPSDPDVGRMEEADFDRLVAERAVAGDSRRWGSGVVEITSAEMLDRNGCARDTFQSTDSVTVRMHYVAHDLVENPVFGIAIHYHNGVQVLGLNTLFSEVTIASIGGRGIVSCDFDSLSLLAGSYRLTISVYDAALKQAYDHQHYVQTFTIAGAHPAEQYGLVTLPHRWTVLLRSEMAEHSKR